MERLAPARERLMVDPANYQGREQALVKHTFLDRYMRDQLMKVGRYGSFTYVDLFAGPWQSQAADYSDTSFGIALQRMVEAKRALGKVGVDVQLSAHLVEKENHEQLREAASRFSDVRITCYAGAAEDHAETIARAIPKSSFRFVVIDPKGLPDPRDFKCLIEPPRTEVLINFMFDFANRFAGTDRMPKLVDWLSTVAPGPEWQSSIDKLGPADREDYITDMARTAIARMGGYEYRPAITVDKIESNRALYKLILLTRHPLGLRVFRDAQANALEVQAGQRSRIHAEKRIAQTNQGELLAAAGLTDPGERSARLLASGRRDAEAHALELIQGSQEGGILWKALWTMLLDERVVTYSALSDAVAGWHKQGKVCIRGLGARARKPKDEHYITGPRGL
jgi:three-Cys-motif partner protein